MDKVTVRMKVDRELADKVRGMPVKQWKEIVEWSNCVQGRGQERERRWGGEERREATSVELSETDGFGSADSTRDAS